jgi:hypothetical protein
MKLSRYDANQDGACDSPQCKNVVIVNRNVAPFTDMEPVVPSSLTKLGIEVKPTCCSPARRSTRPATSTVRWWA